MVDLHSHILDSIDDGSKTKEESFEIISEAIKNGVTDIFATPHYILDSKYEADNKLKEEKIKSLKEKFKNEINLHLGNEIYINNQIEDLILENKITTLASSRYLLVELPVVNEYPALDKYLFKLRSKGYVIIIAHPERYHYFRNDFNKVIELCKQGILFQGNFMSLYGNYGPNTKKMFKKMLKYQCYSFMASDIHHSKMGFYEKLADAFHKIEKITSKEYADKIFNQNGLKVIKNEKIESDFKEKISIFKRIRGKR